MHHSEIGGRDLSPMVLAAQDSPRLAAAALTELTDIFCAPDVVPLAYPPQEKGRYEFECDKTREDVCPDAMI